jgi:hypothetical protein
MKLKKIKTIEKKMITNIEDQKINKEKLDNYYSNQYSTTDSIAKYNTNLLKVEKSFFKSQNEKIKNYISFSKSAIKREKEISELCKNINQKYEEKLVCTDIVIRKEKKKILKKNGILYSIRITK